MTPVWASEARQAVVRSGASIQSAIDRAPAGGTILVEPGIYHETLIIDKPLTVTSQRGAQNTIIEADPSRFDYEDRPRDEIIVGAFNVYETEEVTIEGFTVTNALEGIWVSLSHGVSIKHCIAYGNASSGYYFWASQDAGVTRCTGYDNAVGLYQGQSGNISIERSFFALNKEGTAPHLGGEHGLEFSGVGILIGNRSAGGESSAAAACQMPTREFGSTSEYAASPSRTTESARIGSVSPSVSQAIQFTKTISLGMRRSASKPSGKRMPAATGGARPPARPARAPERAMPSPRGLSMSRG